MRETVLADTHFMNDFERKITAARNEFVDNDSLTGSFLEIANTRGASDSSVDTLCWSFLSDCDRKDAWRYFRYMPRAEGSHLSKHISGETFEEFRLRVLGSQKQSGGREFAIDLIITSIDGVPSDYVEDFFLEMTMQPARHKYNACCLPRTEKPIIRLVLANAHDFRIELVASLFQEILITKYFYQVYSRKFKIPNNFGY